MGGRARRERGSPGAAPGVERGASRPWNGDRRDGKPWRGGGGRDRTWPPGLSRRSQSTRVRRS